MKDKEDIEEKNRALDEFAQSQSPEGAIQVIFYFDYSFLKKVRI
jgi:hypothetical protein